MKMMHITIHTAKLKESVEFYCSILNFSIQESFQAAGGKSITFLKSEDSDVRIELIADEKQAYNGAGLSIGFHAEDIDETYEALKQKGLQPSAIISPNPHTRFFFIEDPNGVSIQII
ncbi:MAG: VOC family protein [Lachnospiraceae bacterium]|nr:VOC family protein [Lachnospiraceae bacterium]